MPRQVIVDAKKPMATQVTYRAARLLTQALAPKAMAVPAAFTPVSTRQSTRFIQNGAPSVPSR